MRTSLAVKIFLSFWLIHALIFVVLALAPDPGASARLIDRAPLLPPVTRSTARSAGSPRWARALLRVQVPRSLRTG